ncbi:hypothetical protein HY640_03695, partial [Candidatus Woesearchaeota archaeon]|nr:hypothetical protein [Candidatus Woesearchaeota archaeon]
MKRKNSAVAQRSLSKAPKTCSKCGFKAYYVFARCPECDAVSSARTGWPGHGGSNRITNFPAIDPDTPGTDLIQIEKPQASKFVFPFSAVRESQQDMMHDVAAAVSAGKHLVADAPTGLGKTIAALFPAVEYAVANGKSVFFLTSRLSQHKAAVETLKLMKGGGNSFKAVDIVGKKHLCSHDTADMDAGMFNNFCTAMIKDKRCSYYKHARSSELTTERAGVLRVLANSIPSTEE